MSIKSFAAKIFASHIRKKIDKWAANPHETQQKVFDELIEKPETPSSVRTIVLGKLNHIQIL